MVIRAGSDQVVLQFGLATWAMLRCSMTGRLNRNPLKGALGDALHAVLCGAGHNIRLLLSLLRLFAAYLRATMLAWPGQSDRDHGCQVALAAA
jgi:hypothetical protein